MDLTTTRHVLVQVDVKGSDEVGGSGRRTTDYNVLGTPT